MTNFSKVGVDILTSTMDILTTTLVPATAAITDVMGCSNNLTSNNGSCNVTTSGPIGTGSMLSDRPEAYIVPILFLFIFVVGVVGNGTLIFTVIRNKNMRNVPNIFIVSLALGDLVLILVSVPFTATIYTFNQWPYGQALCKLNEFLQALSLGVSVFTLTALSGDRYIAIVDPMRRHRGSPTARTFVIAAAIWGFSTVLAVPEAVAAHIQYTEYQGHTVELCILYPRAWGEVYEKYHTMFRFLVYFAIPMVIIGLFYLLMARILVLSARKMPGEMDCKANQHQRQMEARKKVAKVVLSFVIVFVLCWLPRHIYIIWYYYDPGLYNLFWHVFKIIGYCLSFINSCVNPLALYFLSKQFRHYYNRYLFCCCKAHRGRDADYSTMYNFNSTVRRTSTTMTMVPSQSAC